jgi:hypothetical protein
MGEPSHLPIHSPVALQKAVDAIPAGSTGYITFAELYRLTGQTCEQFVSEHKANQTSTISLDPDHKAERLYFVRAYSN